MPQTRSPSPLAMLLLRHTNRREFITLVAGTAAAWPLAARAQRARKTHTIGFLSPAMAVFTPYSTVLFNALRELGWIEGQNIAIERRYAENRLERLPELAAELVHLNVEVIVAVGTLGPLAAKRATSTIPIVMTAAGDPVGSRLVASLARPGGNVTGLSNQGSDLPAKRLGLLREVFPALRRVAVMVNADYSGGLTEREEIDAAAQTLGLDVVPLPIRRVEDIASAFEGLKGRAEVLYITGDPLVNAQRLRINTFALVVRLPTMFSQREYVAGGGLMAYGPNFL